MRTQNLVISAVLGFGSACAVEPLSHAPPPPYGQTVMAHLGAYCAHCVKQTWAYALGGRAASLDRPDGAAIHVSDRWHIPYDVDVLVPGFGVRYIDDSFGISTQESAVPRVRIRFPNHGAFKAFKAPEQLVAVTVLSPEAAVAKRAELDENHRKAAIVRASRSRRKSGWEHFADGLDGFARAMRNIDRIHRDFDEFRERVRTFDAARRAAERLAPLYEAGKELLSRSRTWAASLLPDATEQK